MDTGASCSLLRRDTFETIISKTHRSRILEPTTPLRGVNGTLLNVIGKTEIQISNTLPPLEVVIADNLPHAMILGDTSLRKGRGVIDLYKNVLHWHGKTWPLQRHQINGYSSIGPVAPATGQDIFDELIHDNADVFSAKGEPTGNCGLTELTIKTHGPPICQKAY